MTTQVFNKNDVATLVAIVSGLDPSIYVDNRAKSIIYKCKDAAVKVANGVSVSIEITLL